MIRTNLKRLLKGSSIAGLTLVAGLTYAQSQSGGLPALERRVAALESSVSSLQKTLQAAIANEAATRAAADTALQNAIASLQGSIGADLGQLKTQVASLAAKEAADIAALQKTTTQLQEVINKLPGATTLYIAESGASGLLNNDTDTEILAVDVPAGNYLVSAVVFVEGNDSDFQRGFCKFNTATAGEVQVVVGPVQEDFTFSGIDRRRLVLLGSASVAQPRKMTVTCRGYIWQVKSASLIALPVGALSGSRY